jgi:hypothetical protein
MELTNLARFINHMNHLRKNSIFAVSTLLPGIEKLMSSKQAHVSLIQKYENILGLFHVLLLILFRCFSSTLKLRAMNIGCTER